MTLTEFFDDVYTKRRTFNKAASKDNYRDRLRDELFIARDALAEFVEWVNK